MGDQPPHTADERRTLYAGVNSTLMLVLIFYFTPLGVDLLLSDTMGVDFILLV